jgi:hypothetical protein
LEETETEDGAAEGEVVFGCVEEEVALVEGFEVKRSEESGETEMSSGGEETELDFDFLGFLGRREADSVGFGRILVFRIDEVEDGGGRWSCGVSGWF